MPSDKVKLELESLKNISILCPGSFHENRTERFGCRLMGPLCEVGSESALHGVQSGDTSQALPSLGLSVGMTRGREWGVSGEPGTRRDS